MVESLANDGEDVSGNSVSQQVGYICARVGITKPPLLGKDALGA